MAPLIAQGFVSESDPLMGETNRIPLQLSASLDQFEKFDVTTVIGTEFRDIQLTDFLSSPNSDTLIRDLAILGYSTSNVLNVSFSTWSSILSISRNYTKTTTIISDSIRRIVGKTFDF